MKKCPKKSVPARTHRSGWAGGRVPALALRKPNYLLRLFVSGSTAKSVQAIQSINRVCELHLKNRYILEVIDIYQQPGLARSEQIVAVPTLIRRLPLPLRRLIGDLSNVEKVLFGLDLRPREA